MSGQRENSGGAAETELRELVATAGRILYQRGLTDYLGRCGARVPGTDRVVIKPKHSTTVRSPGELGPADMIVIDLDGNLVEGSDAPPAECFIHTEIYRATVTACSAARLPLPPGRRRNPCR